MALTKTHQDIIEQLVDLLFLIDQGMEGLDEPVPDKVAEGLLQSVIGFEEKAIPLIQSRLENINWRSGFGYVFDAIGAISQPSSVFHLVQGYKHGNFMSGAAALEALRKIGTDDAYAFLSSLLSEWMDGNKNIVFSALDLGIICSALAEWQVPEALSLLERAVYIRDMEGMPQAAIESLAQYSEGRAFLKELSKQEPELEPLIIDVLREQ